MIDAAETLPSVKLAPARPNVSFIPPDHLAEEDRDVLVWFWEHKETNALSLSEQAKCINYNEGTLSKVWAGKYEGNYPQVCDAIRGFKRNVELRGTMRTGQIVSNRNTKLVCSALNYAISAQCIAHVYGHSGTGKTAGAVEWMSRRENIASGYLCFGAECGGVKELYNEIAKACGAKISGRTASELRDAILAKINPSQLLIIDEAGLLLKRRAGVAVVEALRMLRERGGFSVALLSTNRFRDDLEKMNYDFEQLLGRIEISVPLHSEFWRKEVEPLVRQFIPNPEDAVMNAAMFIANSVGQKNYGRMRTLAGVLRLASRVASEQGKIRVPVITSDHFFKAMSIREMHRKGELKEVSDAR